MRLYTYPAALESPPWIRVNFVSSIDGAVTRGRKVRAPGRSTADHNDLPHAARSGRCHPGRRGHGPDRKLRRRTHRRPPPPAPASPRPRRQPGRHAAADRRRHRASAALDPACLLFTDTVCPPLILTTTAAPADRKRALADAGAHVARGRGHQTGDRRADPGRARHPRAAAGVCARAAPRCWGPPHRRRGRRRAVPDRVAAARRRYRGTNRGVAQGVAHPDGAAPSADRRRRHDPDPAGSAPTRRVDHRRPGPRVPRRTCGRLYRMRWTCTAVPPNDTGAARPHEATEAATGAAARGARVVRGDRPARGRLRRGPLESPGHRRGPPARGGSAPSTTPAASAPPAAETPKTDLGWKDCAAATFNLLGLGAPPPGLLRMRHLRRADRRRRHGAGQLQDRRGARPAAADTRRRRARGAHLRRRPLLDRRARGPGRLQRPRRCWPRTRSSRSTAAASAAPNWSTACPTTPGAVSPTPGRTPAAIRSTWWPS